MLPDPPANPTGASAQAPIVNAHQPWLGLLPYKEEHREFFFGRDREVEDIRGRIRDNSLTILYGQSGLGKSSLLAAGVVPRLKEAGYAPRIIRLSYDHSAALLQQTHAALAEAAPDQQSTIVNPQSSIPPSLWQLFHHRSAPTTPIPVLIFDQFEEIFTLGAESKFESEVADWLEQMADLLQNRPPRHLAKAFSKDPALADQYQFGDAPVRIVFTLREDYLANLERWKAQMPLLMQNRMALTLLSGPQARQAVLGPAQLGDHSLVTREVAESIVRTVARVARDTPLDQIKAVPPLLSLLCEQLNAARLSAAAPQITAASVHDQAEDILQRFYVESFDAFPPQHRSVIRALIEDPPMITEGGFRNSLVRDDAQAQLTRAGVPDAKAVFDTLIQRRLITSEERNRVQRLEVTHDVLVPMLLRSRKERQDREAKEKAERAAIAARAEQERLSKERRRLRLVIVGVSFLALVAAGLAIWAVKAQRAALASETQAAAQRDEARYNEGLAWLLRAEVAEERSKRYPETLLYAAQAIGFEGAGRPSDVELPLRYIPAGREAFSRATKWIADRPAYRPVWASPLQKSPVTALRLSPSGRLLAVAHADGRAGLWDMSTGTESPVLPASADPVTDLAFDPAEQTLAISTAKDTQLFDLEKRSFTTAHPGAGSAIAWSPGGEMLVVAGEKGLTLWRGDEAQVISADLSAPARLAFSAENSVIAAAYAGKGVRVFFPHAGTAANAWLTHAADATSVAISPDGARIAIGTAEGGLSLWSSTDARQLGSVPEELQHRGAVQDLAFRPDGRQLASASADGTVTLWSVTTDIPSVLATLCGHTGGVSRVSYTPAGDFLASAGVDGSARLWAVIGRPEPQGDLFAYLDRRFYAFDSATQQAQWAGGTGFAGSPPIIGTASLDRAALLAEAQRAAKENRWHLVDLRLRRLGKTDDPALQQLLTARAAFGKQGQPFTNAAGMNLRWCPPTGPEGFLMGSPETEKLRYTYETQHTVVLTQGFWLSQYEVTQAEWTAVMGSNPSTYATSGLLAPVENISWLEAVEFCRRLTDRERARGTLPPGWEYALPSEAQWEYACRAGTTTAYSFGDDPALLHLHGNYNDISANFTDNDTQHDDGVKYTAPVGSYNTSQTKPNAWGFFDMHGNVLEWCTDALDPAAVDYGSELASDPLGTQGSHRVNRGGGWDYLPRYCRSTSRSASQPFRRYHDLGFRPAVVPPDPRRAAVAASAVAPEKVSGSEPGTKR